MKIYFAYRTGYVPNHRLLKTMEANSVLDWFQQNWDDLCHDEKKLLGFEVYGFSILRHEKVESIPPPKNLKELKAILLENLYLNSLSVNKDCIIGFTDDDEIELAWAVFTEDYAQKHPETTMLWLQDVLPTNFSETPHTETIKGIRLKAKGNENCCTYYLSSVIYDGANLEDLSKPVIIEGVSLPNMVQFFNKNDVFTIPSKKNSYAKIEFPFLQRLVTLFSLSGVGDFVKTVSRYHFGQISNSIGFAKVMDMTADELQTYENVDRLSKVVISEHLVEISLHWEGFYDYIVFFDDYWYNQHPTLAKSLINFHEKAMLGKNQNKDY